MTSTDGTEGGGMEFGKIFFLLNDIFSLKRFLERQAS